jgi:hypothetical protein
MRRAAIVLVLSWSSVGWAGSDDVRGTRGPVSERQHDIQVTVRPGHARLVVRRTVENAGPRHDQALFDLRLPEQAAAIGLRTLGVLDGQPRWFAGELMEAEAAARKYERLTGMGGAYPKDPALLSWRVPGHLLLQVFPVGPADRKTIEYTLVLPTHYAGGLHRVHLPRLGTEALPPRIVVRGGDGLRLGGLPFPSGGSVRWRELVAASSRLTEDIVALAEQDDEDTFLEVADLSDVAADQGPAAPMVTGQDERGVELALAPRGAPLLGGRLAQVRAGPDRVLLRYRIEAAPRLSRVPADAQVVVLLDRSRSLSEQQLASALATAGAYLSHFEAAAVEVLLVDRKVTPLFGRFVPRPHAQARLDELKLEPANGSQVDLALREADRLLARRAPGPRRVLLLTDLHTRSSLRPQRLSRVLAASGALLHIGVVGVGSPELEAQEESPWSAVTRPTGGLVWDATASDQPNDVRAMRRVYEELARPVRLHRFAIAGLDHDAGDGPPSVLDEGEGATFLALRPRAVTRIEASGALWARPVRLALAPDPAESRLWAALVFGQPLHEELSEREMMVLARHGRAVSPVTSYLAIEPGVRPSTEGLNDEEFGVASGTLGGIGRGAGGLGGRRASVDREAFLRQALGEAWQRCEGRGRATVQLETTIAEVVDVPRVSATSPAAARTCLTEATWALELPWEFTDSWRAWTVSVESLP